MSLSFPFFHFFQFYFLLAFVLDTLPLFKCFDRLEISGQVNAFVPAYPSDDLSLLIGGESTKQSEYLRLTLWQEGTGMTGAYNIWLSRQMSHVQWAVDSDGDNVLEEIAGDEDKGVLMHLLDSNSSLPTTSVPWVAFISCDSNVTDYNPATYQPGSDLITTSKRRGAKAVILYSLKNQTCILNPWYLPDLGLDQANDSIAVMVTTNVKNTIVLEGQFNVAPQTAYWFNSSLLENEKLRIEEFLNLFNISETVQPSLDSSNLTSDDGNDDEIQTGEISATVTTPNRFKRQVSSNSQPTPSTSISSSPSSTATSSTVFIMAVLGSVNSTVAQGNPNTNSTINNNNDEGSGGRRTSLAMIILYAITGCVTFLFLIVIMSGAIRAIRNPERYGPRPGGIQPGQSVAGGLTRAILDTFPVVKFGKVDGDDRDSDQRDEEARKGKVIEVPILQRQEGKGRKNEVELVRVSIGNRTESFVSALETPVPKLSQENTREDSMDDQLLSVKRSSIVSQSHNISYEDTAFVADTPTTPTQNQTAMDKDKGKASKVEDRDEHDPTEINDELTCPICVDVFTPGDDIRILPCDQRHRFHRDCIDPWLLNVSALCPLCRLDLSRGVVKEGEEEEELDQLPAPSGDHLYPPHHPSWDTPSPAGRAVRSVGRFVRRKIHERSTSGHEESSSEPPFNPEDVNTMEASTSTNVVPGTSQPRSRNTGSVGDTFSPGRFARYISAMKGKRRSERNELFADSNAMDAGTGPPNVGTETH